MMFKCPQAVVMVSQAAAIMCNNSNNNNRLTQIMIYAKYAMRMKEMLALFHVAITLLV